MIKLAWKMGCYRTSQTWRIIALLYSEEEQEMENDLDAKTVSKKDEKV